MSLKLIVDSRAPLAQVVARGSIDADSARVLRLKIQSVMATGHRVVVLDLSEVEEVDDVGVAMLAYARRIYRIAGGSLSMVGLDAELDARLAVLEAAEQIAVAQAVLVQG